jgi:hypothetical protein
MAGFAHIWPHPAMIYVNLNFMVFFHVHHGTSDCIAYLRELAIAFNPSKSKQDPSVATVIFLSFIHNFESKEEKNRVIMVEAAIQIKYTSTQSNNTPNLGSLSPQSMTQNFESEEEERKNWEITRQELRYIKTLYMGIYMSSPYVM